MPCWRGRVGGGGGGDELILGAAREGQVGNPLKNLEKNKMCGARTFTAPIWFCLAIFLMSAMSFFSWLCRLFRSRSSSRMDLSSIRLFSLREKSLSVTNAQKRWKKKATRRRRVAWSSCVTHLRRSAGVFVFPNNHIVREPSVPPKTRLCVSVRWTARVVSAGWGGGERQVKRLFEASKKGAAFFLEKNEEQEVVPTIRRQRPIDSTLGAPDATPPSPPPRIDAAPAR